MLDSFQAGRFDANPRERRAAFGRLASHATLGAWSEAVGLAVPDPWRRTHGETAIVWNSRVWRPVAHASHAIPTPEWKRGTDVRREWLMAWCLLEDRATGLRVLRAAGHLPAHDQDAARQAALNGLGPALRDVSRDADVVTFTADFNLDLRLRANRSRVRQAGDRARLGLRLHVPPAGTFGRRKIDGVLTNAHVDNFTMLHRTLGFDHRGFSFAALPAA